jgi:gentisate 1,2-dioxygenase
MERIDREAIQKTQEHKEELDGLSIQDLWERLDLLVPNDPTQDLTA